MGGDLCDVECRRLRLSALMVDKKRLLFCYFTTFYYLCIIIHSFLVVCVLRRETVAQIFYSHGSCVKAQRHPISHHQYIIISFINHSLTIVYIYYHAIAAVKLIRATFRALGTME